MFTEYLYILTIHFLLAMTGAVSLYLVFQLPLMVFRQTRPVNQSLQDLIDGRKRSARRRNTVQDNCDALFLYWRVFEEGLERGSAHDRPVIFR